MYDVLDGFTLNPNVVSTSVLVYVDSSLAFRAACLHRSCLISVILDRLPRFSCIWFD